MFVHGTARSVQANLGSRQVMAPTKWLADVTTFAQLRRTREQAADPMAQSQMLENIRLTDCFFGPYGRPEIQTTWLAIVFLPCLPASLFLQRAGALRSQIKFHNVCFTPTLFQRGRVLERTA